MTMKTKLLKPTVGMRMNRRPNMAGDERLKLSIKDSSSDLDKEMIRDLWGRIEKKVMESEKAA